MEIIEIDIPNMIILLFGDQISLITATLTSKLWLVKKSKYD